LYNLLPIKYLYDRRNQYRRQFLNNYLVEVCLKENSTASIPKMKEYILNFLLNYKFKNKIDINFDEDEYLTKNIYSIIISNQIDFYLIEKKKINYEILIFQYSKEEGEEEINEEEESIPACKQWSLPNLEFHNLWESLVFDEDIKNDLLNYSSTSMIFSDKMVDSNLISWNRVILLHGVK
jgi:hypothetical protein